MIYGLINRVSTSFLACYPTGCIICMNKLNEGNFSVQVLHKPIKGLEYAGLDKR